MNRLKRALSFRLLVRFFIMVALFFVLTIVLFFGVMYLLHEFQLHNIQILSPMYKIVSRGGDWVFVLLAILLVVEFIVIFLYYWRKPLDYIEDIIEATANIYDSKDELIKLPIELNEVEDQMNQIKLDIRQNERIAKEAEQRKNDLIVYLAHDLKTPLTSVIGYLSLLRDEKELSEELQEKYLTVALKKAERLEDLINEFFEITRFNLSTLTLELQEVNLTRMLEQIAYEFRPMLLEKGLRCSLAIAPDTFLRCDVDKMQRVFDNLFRNAIFYSFEGEEIQVIVSQDDQKTRLKFINHGKTIPKEKLERIFEQFYRLDVSRGTSSGGAGLGLAIAREIVELHHGTIEAYSENDTIEFEIVIPVL